MQLQEEKGAEDLKNETRDTPSPGMNEQPSLEGADTQECEQQKTSPLKALFRPFTMFYKQLTCPDYSATTDVYAPMFVCDFINFLIIVFGYQAFGPSVCY